MYILYETSGMNGLLRNYILRAGEPDIIAGSILFEDGLLCLVQHGRHMGTKKDQKELDKIATLEQDYRNEKVTWEKLRNFAFNISTGEHKCIAVAQSLQELDVICQHLMETYEKKDRKGTPAGKRFEEILKSIKEEGINPSEDLIDRINAIQYIL